MLFKWPPIGRKIVKAEVVYCLKVAQYIILHPMWVVNGLDAKWSAIGRVFFIAKGFFVGERVSLLQHAY